MVLPQFKKKEITPDVFFRYSRCKDCGGQNCHYNWTSHCRRFKTLNELHLMDPGDYVITFNGGLVQETATGKELIKDLLHYEDYLDIEALLTNSKSTLMPLQKDGIYTSNRDIGRHTIHESQLVNMPVYYQTPEEVREKELSRPCISMNQIF